MTKQQYCYPNTSNREFCHPESHLSIRDLFTQVSFLMIDCIDLISIIVFNIHPFALYSVPSTISPAMTLSTRTKGLTALALVLVLGGLATADYLATDSGFLGSIGGGATDVTGVAKAQAADIRQLVTAMGLEATSTSEATFLSQIAEDDTEAIAVLKDGDRAGAIAWIDSPDVKNHFLSLKDGLLGSFSADLTDLKDVTEQEPGKPVRNMLSFKDPALSEERLVFVRVRERLLEFHITAGGEDTMNALLEELTTK
jgi:hypothetical protein